LSWIFLIGAALLGAYVAQCVHLPAAGMLGAIAGTAMAQSLGLIPVRTIQGWMLVVLYAAIGLLLGLKFTRASLSYLQRIILPALLVPTVMILSGCGLGFLYRVLVPEASTSRLDLATTVLAITPGGFQEMSIAAQDLGAELPVVIFTHLVRIIVVIGVYPWLLHQIVKSQTIVRPATVEQRALAVAPVVVAGSLARWRESTIGRGEQSASEVSSSRRKMDEQPADVRQPAAQDRSELPRWLQWSIVGAGTMAGGAFGRWIGIPAGAVLGAVVGAIIFRTIIGADGLAVSSQARFAIQIALGINLGLQFELGSLATMLTLIVPIAVSLAALIMLSLATGWLIHKLARLDLALALWTTAPAGLSEIALLAEADGIEPLPVLTVHLMRVILIIAIQPSLVRALASMNL